MDKLAYHFNKKKKPAKTEGKFLYYYPCEGLYRYRSKREGMGSSIRVGQAGIQQYP